MSIVFAGVAVDPQEAIREKCFHPRGIFKGFPKSAIEQSVPERFQQLVREYPNRLAVKGKSTSLTYEGLNQAANRVAHAVLATRGRGEEPIALLLEHDAPMIVAIIGILKAAKISVPIDPTYPEKRVAHVLEDSTAGMVVTNNNNLATAQALCGSTLEVLNLDDIDPGISNGDPDLFIAPQAFAYVTYTSGSTGRPKGVVQSHRGLLHKAMLHTRMLHISADDRLSLLHSCSFAGCFYSLFGGLLNGASVFPFDPRLGEGSRLADWVIAERLTIYHSVPLVFRQMLSSPAAENAFPDLRAVNLSGVPMTREDVDLHRRHLRSSCVLINSLGTSEAGYLRHYLIDACTPMTSGRIPVGYPMEDKELTVVDDNGDPVAFGQVGEIVVRSRYLSPGYWKKPELTQRAFLPGSSGEDEYINFTGDLGRMEPDGCLVYIGRKDFQVKVRGYRVDLGEIEIALLDHPALKQVAAVARETRSDDTRVIAYCVPALEAGVPAGELRDFLKERLPDYMVPSAFVMLASLPLTPNGKVDLPALSLPSRESLRLATPFVSPKTAIENHLSAIWCDLLSLDEVGTEDNFFDIGGHSLLATQVVSRIRQTFHAQVSVRALFQNPTIAGLAVEIGNALTQMLVVPDDVADLLSDVESLSEEETRRLLLGKSPEQSAFLTTAAVAVPARKIR